MRIPTPLASGIAAVSAVALTVMFIPASASVGSTASSAPSAAVVTADQRAQGTLDSTVRGTFRRDGTVRGTFTPKRFIVKKGDVFAQGVLHAVMRRGDGTVLGRPNQEITIPIASGTVGARDHVETGECQILNLRLGPLDLNLLGLEVHLKRVVLDIVAVPGPGNLLGNLLCAIAHLLDDLDISLVERLRLANLLNRVLGLL